MIKPLSTKFLLMFALIFVVMNSFSQDCEQVKSYYAKKKFQMITYLFDNNIPLSLVDERILNSPCIDYYILALEKTKNYNNLFKVSDAIAKSSNRKNVQFPDSVNSAIISSYKYANQAGINIYDLGNITRWILSKNELNKNILSELFHFYKKNRSDLNIYGSHSAFLTNAARIYIWNYGVNDQLSLEMFDMLNSVYKQSASGKFFPYEVSTKEEYDNAVKNGFIQAKDYSVLNLGSNFDFSDVPQYANRLQQDQKTMLEWFKIEEKIEKVKAEKLDFYYQYFSKNHHYYKAALAYYYKFKKEPHVKEDYKAFYSVLSKIPSEMFPEANKIFQSTLDEFYESNKNSCAFQRDYISLLTDTKQFGKGIIHINQIKNEFGECLNWDSILLEFRISKIFNLVDVSQDPLKVFQTSINEKIPFNRINDQLKFFVPNIKSKTLGELFFSLDKKYPEYQDSIWWGFCDHLFPMTSFNEKELNQFLLIYKKLKMREMVDQVYYALWYGKSHDEVLDAIRSKKISKNAGWQIIGEYGIYYYSESESRNSAETKKTSLNLLKQAAAYFPEDGELQKHIGHCLFLLGRSSEAQPYYKRANALGANMTDVGALGGKGVRTGSRGGKYNFKISPGTVNSQEP
jgi:hypothetical protein